MNTKISPNLLKACKPSAILRKLKLDCTYALKKMFSKMELSAHDVREAVGF